MLPSNTNNRRTLVGNTTVGHSNVVGASLIDAARSINVPYSVRDSIIVIAGRTTEWRAKSNPGRSLTPTSRSRHAHVMLASRSRSGGLRGLHGIARLNVVEPFPYKSTIGRSFTSIRTKFMRIFTVFFFNFISYLISYSINRYMSQNT